MRGHYRAGVQTGDRGGRELQRQGALGWRGVLGGQGGLLFYSWISTLIKCRINDALSLANNSAVFLHSIWVDTSHSFLFLAKSVSDSISLFVSLLFYLSLLPISLSVSLSFSLLLFLCLVLSPSLFKTCLWLVTHRIWFLPHPEPLSKYTFNQRMHSWAGWSTSTI